MYRHGSAASWFPSIVFVLTVLRQGVEGLRARITLTVDHPGGVALYPRIIARRRLARIWAPWAAFDIRKTASRRAEEFFLIGTMGTPRGAVEFCVVSREMFRQAADPRIFRPRGLAPIAGIVEMQCDHEDDCGSQALAEPWSP